MLKNLRSNRVGWLLLIAIVAIPLIAFATRQTQTPASRFSAPIPTVDLSAFNIIYFAPQDTTNRYTQASLLERDGIQAVYTWDDFAEKTQDGAVDAVILHADLLHQIDAETISAQYDSGVVIAGFNFTGSQMAQITGNPSISQDGFASEATGRHFVISMRRDSASRRNSTELIDTQEGYQFFKFDLFTALDSVSVLQQTN